jgi:putative transposase
MLVERGGRHRGGSFVPAQRSGRIGVRVEFVGMATCKEGARLARRGQYFLPDQSMDVIQRGNNREAAFFHEEDYALYRDWLAEAAAEYGCAIHGYVLMTNHVHLLVTPRTVDSVPRTMQSLGRRFVRHINATYRRTGTLWEGR